MNHETHLLTNKTLCSVPINPTVPPLFQLTAMKYYSETWNLLLERTSINLVILLPFSRFIFLFSKHIQMYWFQVYIHLSLKLIYAAFSDYLIYYAVPNSNIFLEDGSFSKLKYSLHFSLHDNRPILSIYIFKNNKHRFIY